MVWKPAPAAGVQSGQADYGSNVGASGGNASLAVTFPTAYAVPPRVTVMTTSGRLNVTSPIVTTTGFTFSFYNFTSGATAVPPSFTWTAIP